MGLQTRTTLSGSEDRLPSWHTASDLAANRRLDADGTLGLDEEWEDVPTAHLESSNDEATADVEPPQAQLAPIAREPAATQTPARPLSMRGEEPRVASPREQLRPISDSAPRVAAIKKSEPAARRAADTPERSAPVPRDITPGTLLCHRYVLGRLLGAGGSSLIFQAEDRRRVGAEDFGNRIAIKVLRPELRNNTHALTRLRREFRQMQRLSHPGIAKVHDISCDEDIWFMTMELIEGQTINQWLKASSQRIEGMKVISACCEALHHAHEAGVVHGDLKPSNVLVLANGGVKLVDFGSAAERDASMGVIDKERSFAATPPYASPQVLAGEVADPRDDVFSLGCLTYAVLTRGEHPFERKSSAEAQQAQMRPAYAPGILPRQFEVIVRALAWDREQRPATVREFMHALLASDLRREPSARDSAPADAPSKPLPPTPTPIQEPIAPTSAAPTPAPTTGASESPQRSEAPKPASEVKPEDVARLKAAVAAAEAHAKQVEAAAAKESRAKATKADPLDRFKGYVAGPMAHGDEAEPARPTIDEPQPSPAKKKWSWPWQRSALFGAVLVTATAIIASRVDFNSEPIRRAEARTSTQAGHLAQPVERRAAVTPPAPVIEQVEEKKSPPVAVKPKAPPAAPGEVSFTTRTLQIGANQTVAALSVKRVNSTRGRAKVAWTIEGGTARRGVHYDVENPQIMEFLDGQSVRSLFIPLMPDKDAEGVRRSKTFTVKLQPTTGGLALGEIKQVYVTIVGDVTDDEMTATTANTDTE